MTVRLEAQPLVEARSHHAEGPCWDPGANLFLWVDQYQGLVRRTTVDARSLSAGDVTDLDLGAPVGAVVPHADGGWLVAAGTEVVHVTADGRRTPVADVLPDDGVRRRWNDGKVDPLGRFWAGSITYDQTPGAAALYLLERGRTTVVLPSVTVSNGMAWTPDGATMYYIDTPTQEVRRFAVAGAELRDEGPVVRIDPDDGSPDGMTIDDEGCLWVAVWGGGEVRRFAPSGELLARVHVDAPQVSSCAFGGPDRDVLFVTTSQENYDDAQSRRHAQAGKVFAVRPGVTGPPAAAYLP